MRCLVARWPSRAPGSQTRARPPAPGATRWQVADQADRLTAAVTKLLGPGRATGAFVAATAGGAAAQPASGDQRIQAQSLLVGSAPTGDALLDDGFMQFEGPSYGPAGAFAIQEGEATTATAGTETGASTGSDATLTVTVAAAGADPLALHKHADDATRCAGLACGALARCAWRACCPAGQAVEVPTALLGPPACVFAGKQRWLKTWRPWG